jgi:hypothetical protein
MSIELIRKKNAQERRKRKGKGKKKKEKEKRKEGKNKENGRKNETNYLIFYKL